MTTPSESKPKCPICKKFLFEAPLCVCKKAPPGEEAKDNGDEMGADDNSVKGKADAKPAGRSDEQEDHAVQGEDDRQALTLRLDEKLVDTSMLSEWLAQRLLVIENNHELGLAIHLRCQPSHLTETQRQAWEKWLTAILAVHEAMKKENQLKSDYKTLVQDKQEHTVSLVLRMTPGLYEAFIRRLIEKHLIPSRVALQKKGESVHYASGMNHFHLKPSMGGKKKPEDDMQTAKSPRPFKTPREGLKPNGCS